MAYRLTTPVVSSDDFVEFKDALVITSASFCSLSCDGGTILLAKNVNFER